MYVCQRVFVNMAPQHQPEPPRAACGSLIMSLRVLANYCCVMVIDKAINAVRDYTRWSAEIPSGATQRGVCCWGFFFLNHNLVWCSQVWRSKQEMRNSGGDGRSDQSCQVRKTDRIISASSPLISSSRSLTHRLTPSFSSKK